MGMYLLIYLSVGLLIFTIFGVGSLSWDRRYAARAILIAPVWPLALVYGVLYAVYWIFRNGRKLFMDLWELAEWSR